MGRFVPWDRRAEGPHKVQTRQDIFNNGKSRAGKTTFLWKKTNLFVLIRQFSPPRETGRVRGMDGGACFFVP